RPPRTARMDPRRPGQENPKITGLPVPRGKRASHPVPHHHAPHRQRPRGPRRRPRHTPGEGMTADPQIQAHLHRLADETGIPYDALAAWANQPAPAGIDHELWRQAGRNRILNGAAWNPAQLEALRRQVAATRAAATAAEAPCKHKRPRPADTERRPRHL